jgi:hypothetical protein
MCALRIQENSEGNLRSLIRILQMAYSGEKAAALAYSGHWEEWEHREEVGRMLALLGSHPVWWREIMMCTIGKTVSTGCFLIGWFFPMYLAGQLETNNVDEYEVAAQHAQALGLELMTAQLLAMARTERLHESYFASLVVNHPWLDFANAVFRWHPERLPARSSKTIPLIHLPVAKMARATRGNDCATSSRPAMNRR